MSEIALKLFFVLLVAVLVSACGGDESSPTPTSAPIPEICMPTQDSIAQAYDDHTYDDIFEPSLTIDDDLSTLSRWSSLGDGKWIFFDLGSAKDVREIHTAWYKGDERISTFDLESSLDAVTWTVIESGIQSQGGTDLETNEIASTDARFIRLVGRGNTDSEWNSLIEVEVYTCGETGTATTDPMPIPTPTATPDEPTPPSTPTNPLPLANLDPLLPPGSNFDLLPWYVSLPTDNNGNGFADSIYENELNDGFEDSDYFYTGNDGGMVFRCPLAGFKTSNNTNYTRVELRGMLRRGNTSISTQGVNANNWVFSSAPIEDQIAAGGVDGNLRATLAVNYVPTSGGIDQVGRVIIGQIHANDDEPVRLYYRKLPENELGSIYFAHEPIGLGDINHELIGSRGSSTPNPVDGIALDEVFSYELDVQGNVLSVSILREGKDNITKSISMGESGYDQGNQYMYFKAGAYNQNNTGSDSDYSQVTFYGLEATHD